eukprot:Tbor_TRINITY_DN5144_c1_g1::TRINITY_DN5144_c1_g1_i1::g.25902::m.25902
MSQDNVCLSIQTWLTSEDWLRVHRSFRPNVVDITDFKFELLKGDPGFLKLEQLRKVVTVVREMLLERGRISEAKSQGWHQNKALLYSHLISCLTMIPSETTVMSNNDGPQGATYNAAVAPVALSAPNSYATSVPLEVRLSRGPSSVHHAPSPPMDSGEAHIGGVSAALGRPVQLVSGIQERRLSGGGVNIICAPSSSDEPLGSIQTSNLTSSWTCTNEESSKDKNTSCESPPLPRCLSGFSHYCSPLLPVVLEVKRFFVHQGATFQSFQISPELTSLIQSRKCRVILMPVQGAYTPAQWPHIKEFTLQVNNEYPQSTWKRQWARKNITTSYLVLDITHLLSHRAGVQRIQMHSTAKDYSATMVISVAASVSPEDLITSILDEPTTLRGSGMTAMQLLRSRYLAYAGVKVADDCQEDDVIPTTAPTLSVKCPISQCPISIPMRGKLCDHLQPVDLNAFLRSSHTGCFWNCPICDAKVRYDDIIVDRPLMTFLKSIPSNWRLLRLIVNDEGRNLKPSELSLEHFSWVRANRERYEGVEEYDSDISSGDEDNGRPPMGQKRARDPAVLGSTACDAIEVE